jgi:peroxiredoxin
VHQLQPELPVNYCSLITVSVDGFADLSAARDAIAADWTFLSDARRKLLHELEMVDTTDDLHGEIYIPYTFVLDHDRTIHKIYNGWWYLGRPTVEELRVDLRELMRQREDWVYPGD